MATAELTWNNNSADSNPAPTTNKIERLEQLDFTHSEAESRLESLVNSDVGGLDPKITSGAYTDDTVEVDKHYTYRIKTFRDDEYVTSSQGEHKYVYDITQELGYPGGDPDTATYNIDVTPAIHVDAARQPRYDYSQLNGEVAYLGMEESVRHNNTGQDLRIGSTTASFSPRLASITLNGNSRRMFKQPHNTPCNITLNTRSGYYTSSDGYTIFLACRMYNNDNTITYLKALGGDVAGNVTRDDIYYTASGLAIYKNSMTAQVMGATFNGVATSLDQDADNNVLLCVRFNNTIEQYNTDILKAQMFEAGELIGQSDDLKPRSYHGQVDDSNTTTLFNTKRGAFHLDNGNGTMKLIDTNYIEHGFFEYIMFPDRLSAGQMNQVFAYLGNKYNRVVQDVQQNELIG